MLRRETRRSPCCGLALLLCCAASASGSQLSQAVAPPATLPSAAQSTQAQATKPAATCPSPRSHRRHHRGKAKIPAVTTPPPIHHDPPLPAPPKDNPQPQPWPEAELVKEIADGGIALVSLAFAAFTFLYGALLTLKDEDSGDRRVRQIRSRLKYALNSTAAAITSSTVMTGLAFASLVTHNRAASIATFCLAAVILLGLSGIAWFLAYDVFAESRHD